MTERMSLGARIHSIRLKNGLTQIELAKGICTPSMISQIESDKANPSHTILTKLAERLDVSLEDLLSDLSLTLATTSKYNMAKAMIANGEFSGALLILGDLSQVLLPPYIVRKLTAPTVQELTDNMSAFS